MHHYKSQKEKSPWHQHSRASASKSASCSHWFKSRRQAGAPPSPQMDRQQLVWSHLPKCSAINPRKQVPPSSSQGLGFPSSLPFPSPELILASLVVRVELKQSAEERLQTRTCAHLTKHLSSSPETSQREVPLSGQAPREGPPGRRATHQTSGAGLPFQHPLPEITCQ